MCKHILNAQVAVRAQCCKRWFDCPDCHAEVSDHPLRKTDEMVFVCKKCKKAFRKNANDELEEQDEYCPHCDNHYVIEAKTPTPKIKMETEDVRKDSSFLQDMRMRPEAQLASMFDIDASHTMG